MGIPTFDRLGAELDVAWQAFDYDPVRFPELARDALEKARLPDAVRPTDVVQWALLGDLPLQFDQVAIFGQPPITVFRTRRFFIEVLFWLDGTTNVHDHTFAGAFQVLHGSSIETTFAFEPRRVVDGHFQLGQLRIEDAALRRAGDVQLIVPGPTYIHGLFHLERPSVTILVRSQQAGSRPLPMQYHTCGLAFNPFFADDRLSKMLQVVEMLRKSDDPTFDSMVGDLVGRSDLHTAFRVIHACADISDQRRLEALLGKVRDRDAAQIIGQYLSDERTLRFLRKRRSYVHEAALRFLLAVLLNSHRGEDSIKLVSAYFGDGRDPAAQIASWLAQLSKVTMRLQAGGTPWEPNVLNLPEFEDGFEAALADALAGRPHAFTPAESAFLDRLRALPHLAPLFGD